MEVTSGRQSPDTHRLVGVDVGDPERLLHGVDVGLAQDGSLGELVGGAGQGEVAGDVEDLGLLVALRRARRVQGLEADDGIEAALEPELLQDRSRMGFIRVGENLQTGAAVSFRLDLIADAMQVRTGNARAK